MVFSSDVSWRITRVFESSRGVTVRTEALFSANPHVDWLAPARTVYGMLRTGNCAQALYARAWGPTCVQQVSMPYIATGKAMYAPGSVIHGLNFNVALRVRSPEWLTLARANNLLQPLRSMTGVMATNAWKHSLLQPGSRDAVAVTIQAASRSARALANANANIKVKHELFALA
ncbi:hypothetical protein H632_c114p1 [Helicosporidium sp. ATCC 50920]|nr:hypothetical protein H632_c114p1 [Helicosporidium sp. ATCC 50920]|eukprot:KDD76763.1 hypothetical protein H632_c114p1 [Helicosporidium sp. ATCC 50920]